MKMTEVQMASKDTTNQQAFDEAMRELDVRGRCYPKWLKEGKISHSDCTVRFAAQARIVHILSGLPDVTANATENSTEWKPF